MANISNEIRAFQNAVYGEEVRSSMISAIQKINTVTESCESTVNTFSSNISSATTAANNAASNANTAATNANNAATAANTAKNAANTAASNANAAVTSANNAASNANSAATSANNAEAARVTAENARANAESTRQANESARQSAEQARVSAEATRANSESARDSAESARQTNEITRQGNERQRQNSETLRENAESSRASGFSDMQAAFADMQRTVIPQATESTMGGVIVGDGLSVDNALLSLANTKSKSGTAVASNGAALESVIVYGQSVQDGTPTPDAPVPVDVVSGKNLLPLAAHTVTNKGVTATVDTTGTVTITGTATGGNAALTIPVASDVPLANNVDYTAQRITMSGSLDGTFYIRGIDDDNQSVHHLFNLASVTERTARFTNNAIVQTVYIVVQENTTIDCVLQVQLEAGTTATPYVPYGSIGIVVGDTATPINLQGNTLASLPDGTRDELLVDSAGHCVIEKNIYAITLNGGAQESWTDGASGRRKTLNLVGIAPTIRNVGSNSVVPSIISNRFVSVSAGASYASSIGVSQNTIGTSIYINLRGSEAVSMTDWIDWLAANPVTVYYPLETPQTIDLGYIDPPAIPEDGATVSVSSSITPVIDVSWWENGAAAIASAISKLMDEIKSLKAQIAALATS